jgi:opacity protein-like surface antigen
MTIGKFLASLVVVTALCLNATALRAQGISVFGMGTVSSIFDQNRYQVPAGQFQSDYKTGAGFTLGVEAPLFFRIVGLEGSYSIVRNNLTVTDYAISPSVESSYGVRNQRFSGDVVVHAPKFMFHLKPYLAVGVEFDRYTPLEPSSGAFGFFNGYTSVKLNPDNLAGFNYGGGVDYRLMRWINFRVDIRDHVTGSPTYGLPGSSSTGLPIFPISGAAHDLEYSAGLVFRLGR